MTGKAWTDRDRLLAMALVAYEDSLCSGCGQPKERAYHPDMIGWYEAAEDVRCAGCAALHDHAKDRKDDPEPGAKVRLVDTRPVDLPLPEWVRG